MSYRWIGAIFILSGCGGFGLSLAAGYKKQELFLRRLIRALRFMEWELSYRLTPLPELLRKAGKHGGGSVRRVLENWAVALETQVLPDAGSAMEKALGQEQELPREARRLLRQLGASLGEFDLSGQLESLKAVRQSCSAGLEILEQGKAQRLRSYETLGFCAGAALVILFV